MSNMNSREQDIIMALKRSIIELESQGLITMVIKHEDGSGSSVSVEEMFDFVDRVGKVIGREVIRMETSDVELFPSDTKLTVDTIAELQEENKKLKNKLEKIKRILEEMEPLNTVIRIREVLEKE